MKKYLFLLPAFLFFTGKGVAQVKRCNTDEVFSRAAITHPEILTIQTGLDRQIKEGLKKIDYAKAARTTGISGNDTFWYDIPIVIHIIHDFNNTQEYLNDTAIFNYIIDWNRVFAKENYDTSTVIEPFKKYIGNARIRLHLATFDSLGNPMRGITRHRSYLTYGGEDQAKLDDWNPSHYLNIWSVNSIILPASGGADVSAYAYYPSVAAIEPYYDGIISGYQFLNDNYLSDSSYSTKTISHELGHVFNLYETFSLPASYAGPCVECGDDSVDDTPPTTGHCAGGFCTSCGCTSSNLYDTTCASNYFKIYPRTVDVDSLGADSIFHYPDTVNSQNIMDYTECARMFTIGQTVRMHQTLNSDVAQRDSLWAPDNLVRTGVTDASGNFTSWQAYNQFILPDLPAIPDFNVKSVTLFKSGLVMQFFTAPGIPLAFYDESWNDTIQSTNWNFSNTTSPDTTLTTSRGSFTKSFNQPGWVTLTLTANGNNTTPGIITDTQAVFVTNNTGTNGDGYYQEFNPDGDVSMWPMFNYYNNEFHWQLANVGYYDNYCMMYTGYDNRINTTTKTYPVTGDPQGDFDDFFSVPIDLSSSTFADTCNLNFMYSGATRSSNVLDMNDKFEIDYSVDSSRTWAPLSTISGVALTNMGTDASSFTPSSVLDWSPMTVGIPKTGRTPYTIFRFRYFPGSGGPTGFAPNYSTGNNFYIDRINFSTWPASISTVKVNNNDIAVVPNPTHGNAYIVVNDASNTIAQVSVTDIAGKIVYTTEQQLTGSETRIEIPKSAISVQGMYMVQVVTGNQARTQKLVVY